MSLGSRDCRILLAVIESLYAARTPRELHRSTREGLASLVPGDCYDLVLLGDSLPDGEEFLAKPGTYTDAEIAYMLANAEKHPLVQAFLRGVPGTLCISQLISHREWRSSAFFAESGYQRLGLRHELAALIPSVSETSMAAFSIARTGRDFSPRDLAIIDQLRPHLGRAWKQALSRTRQSSPALTRKLFPQLSEREAEVLFLITEGKQNREIADILERSLNTVQEHVENLVRKLGLENRHSAAVYALRAMMAR